MDVCDVGYLVDELGWVDVQVLLAALLADESFGALRIAAHVFTDLLVDLALRVDQVAAHA